MFADYYEWNFSHFSFAMFIIGIKYPIVFCILSFKAAASWNWFINFNSFSIYNIMPYVNIDIWLPILIPFTFAFLNIFNIMLNKNSENWRFFLVPNLKGNSFNLILAVALSYIALVYFRYISAMPNLLRIFNC